MPEIDPLDPSHCLNQKVVELETGGSHTFKERSEDMGSWQVINCYQRHHHHDKHHHRHHHGRWTDNLHPIFKRGEKGTFLPQYYKTINFLKLECSRHVLLHVSSLSRKGRVALKYNLQAVKKVLSIEAKGDGEEVCMRRLFCSLKYI